MRAVIQRVTEAKVSVNGKTSGKIDLGLVVLLGVHTDDQEDDLTWVVKKICNMRIFSDREEKMNLSVKQVEGNILLISQFTLHALTKKGNRPSFIEAAAPKKAISLYEKGISLFSKAIGKEIQTGTFGKDMAVSLINDGPVTITIDSKNRK